MSVSIRWAATAKGKSFSRGSSTSLGILTQTFGAELEMDESAVPILRAMARADQLGGAFYDEVADAIEAAGAIRVWGVW